MKLNVKCLLNQIRDLRAQTVQLKIQNETVFQRMVMAQSEASDLLMENFKLKHMLSTLYREAA